MPSAVDLCNQALSQIRADSISDLGEGSLEADACRAVYDETRRFVLRDSPWPFATETVALAQVGTDHPDGWAYVYDYPNACLRLLKVGPRGSFRQVSGNEGDNPLLAHKLVSVAGRRAILSDIDKAFAQIIVDQVDPSRFDPQFTHALVWYIAAQIAVPVVGVDRGRALRNDALSMYRAVVDAARSTMQNESTPAPQKESDFVSVRY